MRGAVFADTGFWVARISPDDHLHNAARDIGHSLGARQVVTSELVLVETLNIFSGSGAFARDRAARVVEALRTDAQTEIVPQTPQLFDDALALYRERGDKAWSLTDCTSFVIMRKRKIETALAHDRHFEQAGFKALLRD